MAVDPICGMDVDENKGLPLSYQGTVYFFCSPGCLKKFARQHNIPARIDQSRSLPASRRRWYTNKTVIISGVIVFLIALSHFVPVLIPLRTSLLMYARTIWWAIILGLLLGGMIDHFIPREYISSVLARRKKRTIFYAVVLGFFMSACSHGILAIAMELHKKGASNPAVVAFLLASPWANITLTVMLVGFFGANAFFIIFSAIIIAIITGLIFQVLEKYRLIETNANSIKTDDQFSILDDVRRRFKEYSFSAGSVKSDIKGVFEGAVSLGNMIVWWILLGLGIASILGAYVPTSVFQRFLGPTLTGLLITLALATVIEVCSEGSAPLAFEIFRQTGALGNSFVFLMAGVVTDYTEIGLIWHNVGKKTALWLPLVTVPQVMALGMIANIFL